MITSLKFDRFTMSAHNVLLFALLLTCATGADAHEAAGLAGGFTSGFMHPLLGWDHVAAMVAVGLWGAVLGRRAIWLLPVVFPLVMAFGGALGVIGIPLPSVEIGIALSALVLGCMVFFAARPPLWAAAIIVGLFAVFHGHAHGTELPEAASPLAFSLGFVLATGLLHLCGILISLLSRWRAGRAVVRSGGAIIAVAGAMFLLRAF
jgi:urease accessory protein